MSKPKKPSLTERLASQRPTDLFFSSAPAGETAGQPVQPAPAAPAKEPPAGAEETAAAAGREAPIDRALPRRRKKERFVDKYVTKTIYVRPAVYASLLDLADRQGRSLTAVLDEILSNAVMGEGRPDGQVD